MRDRIGLIARPSVPAQVLQSAIEIERRFGVSFQIFANFDHRWLKQIYSSDSENRIHDAVSQGVLHLKGDASQLNKLETIANRTSLTQRERQEYLATFLSLLSDMPFEASSANLLAVAPAREGMLLAQNLGWSAGNLFSPHIKRITRYPDLAIGVEHLPRALSSAQRCRIIDGAIASGATVLTIMEIYSNVVEAFDIFTVHCTPDAMSALLNYARLLRKNITIYAAFVSGRLNDHFYAVSDNNPYSLLVGDVGDIISPLLE
jgi:hypothetical protein